MKAFFIGFALMLGLQATAVLSYFPTEAKSSQVEALFEIPSCGFPCGGKNL